MAEDNGILARVPGPLIGAGNSQLPKAGPEQEGEPVRQVVVRNVPDLGAVRITFRLRTYRHRRTRLWHWVADHAEVIGDT